MRACVRMFNAVWCALLWCGVVWCGVTLWCGVALWCGLWCGVGDSGVSLVMVCLVMVWCGVVRCGSSQSNLGSVQNSHRIDLISIVKLWTSFNDAEPGEAEVKSEGSWDGMGWDGMGDLA